MVHLNLRRLPVPSPLMVCHFRSVQAFAGHHEILTRLIRIHDGREGKLRKLQVQQTQNSHATRAKKGSSNELPDIPPTSPGIPAECFAQHGALCIEAPAL